MCDPSRRVATLRGRWCSPTRLAQGCPGAIGAGDGTCGLMRAACGRLLGREAERFGMGPAVVPGQDLTEAAGSVRDGAVADLAAGDRQPGKGHGEAAERRLAHLPLWCQPSRSDGALSFCRTHSTRHDRMGTTIRFRRTGPGQRGASGGARLSDV